jgi:hypothetical protein
MKLTFKLCTLHSIYLYMEPDKKFQIQRSIHLTHTGTEFKSETRLSFITFNLAAADSQEEQV